MRKQRMSATERERRRDARLAGSAARFAINHTLALAKDAGDWRRLATTAADPDVRDAASDLARRRDDAVAVLADGVYRRARRAFHCAIQAINARHNASR